MTFAEDFLIPMDTARMLVFDELTMLDWRE
jgi:hypothetical protein